MQKLSLKNAKSTLSRKEMKAISGGYGGGRSVGCGDYCGHVGGAVCNEFGTCNRCGPNCTCV